MIPLLTYLLYLLLESTMPCSVCKGVGHNKRSCPNSKPVETPIVSKEVDECPICYEEIGAKNFLVTSCGHKFCLGCIPKHLANSNSCPMCRSDILDEPIAATRPAHGPGSISQITDHTFRFGYDQGYDEGYDEGHSEGRAEGLLEGHDRAIRWERWANNWMARRRREIEESTAKIQDQEAEISRLTRMLIEYGIVTELGFVMH